YAKTNLCAVPLVRLLLARDDSAQARRVTQELVASCLDSAHLLWVQFRSNLAEADLYDGDAVSAHRRWREFPRTKMFVTTLRRSMITMQVLDSRARAGVGCVAQTADSAARAEAERWIQKLERYGEEYTTAAALAMRAALAFLNHDQRHSLGLLEKAGEVFARNHLRVHVAAALRKRGEWQ